MLEGGCGITLLQERYATNCVVPGLLGGFKVFADIKVNTPTVSRHTPEYQSHSRVEILSEWVVANSLHILAEPRMVYV